MTVKVDKWWDLNCRLPGFISTHVCSQLCSIHCPFLLYFSFMNALPIFSVHDHTGQAVHLPFQL